MRLRPNVSAAILKSHLRPNVSGAFVPAWKLLDVRWEVLALGASGPDSGPLEVDNH